MLLCSDIDLVAADVGSQSFVDVKERGSTSSQKSAEVQYQYVSTKEKSEYLDATVYYGKESNLVLDREITISADCVNWDVYAESQEQWEESGIK